MMDGRVMMLSLTANYLNTTANRTPSQSNSFYELLKSWSDLFLSNSWETRSEAMTSISFALHLDPLLRTWGKLGFLSPVFLSKIVLC